MFCICSPHGFSRTGEFRHDCKDKAAILLAAAALAAVPAPAIAAETIAYRYDARGRLVKVERSGSVNNGVVTDYSFDKADNRTVKTTTGSPNPPPP